MDQSIRPGLGDRKVAIENLKSFVTLSIRSASAHDAPFYHLRLDRVFPEEIYRAMQLAMPAASDYRPMSGRSRRDDLPNGAQTRVKMDLFPEHIRALPPEKQSVWDIVGAAPRSHDVKRAFTQRLAPALRRRFGANFAQVGMYPIPILTRDVPGYRIPPHPDTSWKGMTVQLYLPFDDSASHVGTIFHERLRDGNLRRRAQMKFSPNTGYAFAVGDDTWHSADTVGPEVQTRDSILLTYFVDAGVLRVLRNRGKRVGNLLGQQVRRWLSR